MISKTTQSTLLNWSSNNLSYDAKFTKCGDSENSFLFESYGFSNNRLLFLFPWERGLAIGNSGTQLIAVQWYWGSFDATP